MFLLLESLALTNFLKAELGFLGVVVKIFVQVPLFCGHLLKAFNL
jgi:hypothetical protein